MLTIQEENMMKFRKYVQIGSVVFLVFFSVASMAGEHDPSGDVCVGYGPQTPIFV